MKQKQTTKKRFSSVLSVLQKNQEGKLEQTVVHVQSNITNFLKIVFWLVQNNWNHQLRITLKHHLFIPYFQRLLKLARELLVLQPKEGNSKQGYLLKTLQTLPYVQQKQHKVTKTPCSLTATSKFNFIHPSGDAALTFCYLR